MCPSPQPLAAACRLVADSESSSIRQLDLRTGGGRSVAGGDPLFAGNLFKAGDRDGSGAALLGRGALLQHPMDVAVTTGGGRAFVADSFNHKVKGLDLDSGRVCTIAGTESSGWRDGDGTRAQFAEPGGLCALPNGAVLVADTNNHAVRVISFPVRPWDSPGQTHCSVSTLELNGIHKPCAGIVSNDHMGDAVSLHAGQLSVASEAAAAGDRCSDSTLYR